jgi:hypothetical protein
MENHGADPRLGKHIPEATKLVQYGDGQMDVSKLVIDDPADYRLTKPAGTIRGWFAVHRYEIPEDFQFCVGPLVVPHRLLRRQDVEGAMPEHSVTGFQMRYDLMNYLPYIDEKGLLIRLELPDFDPLPMRFIIEERALANCIAAAAG